MQPVMSQRLLRTPIKRDLEFTAMDVRTLILLTPVAIFVAGCLIWVWTNEL